MPATGGGSRNAPCRTGGDTLPVMLKTRVLTAALLLAVFVSALFLLPANGWLAFCTVCLGLAAWEWASLAAFAAGGRALYAAFVVGLFLAPAVLGTPGTGPSSQAPPWTYAAAALFWSVAVPLWIWRQPRIRWAVLRLGVGLVVLLPAAAALVDLRGLHPGLLLALLASVWISDTAAYFVGRRFGRHKLAPAISPGKTWEGVGGALGAVTLYALAWMGLSGPAGIPVWPNGTPMTRLWIVPVLLGLAVAGMIGDLFESLIKRHAGVKDSGTLLPGHGGILDRIDAIAAMLPIAALVFMR